MPIEDEVHEVFTPSEYLGVQHCKKSCNHGPNPKGNGLKEIMLQLFIPDVIKGVFNGFPDKEEDFQHLFVFVG